MINSGREWDWMDEELLEDGVEEEGVLLSDEIDPREF